MTVSAAPRTNGPSSTVYITREPDARPTGRAIVIPQSSRGRPLATEDAESMLSSTSPERGKTVRAPFVRQPTRVTQEQFVVLGLWEGTVTEVHPSYFIADVIDLESDEYAVAEFDMSDVSTADKPLCHLGALFYWSIGYDISRSGQRKRCSVLSFRRLIT